MDDLHKPLGTGTGKAKGLAKRNINWLGTLVVAGIIGLVALATYYVVEARRWDKIVVAINDAEQSAEQTPPKTTGAPGEKPAQGEEATDDQDDEFNLNKVKKLSPLLPLEGTVAEQAGIPPPEKPAFTPRPTPVRRLSDWVPVPDLVEQSEFGRLPKVSDTGVRPLDAYSKSSGTIGANRVALIVGGLGISQTGTQAAIKDLPSEITLGFSPFGNSLQRWMQAARREGHEVVLQLPMEPLGYPTINPGPRTLTSQATAGQNLQNLRWSMARMTNYPVVVNYLGAGLSNKPEAMRPILDEIRRRGLGYIDDGSVRSSRAIEIAKEMSLPHAQGAMVMDVSREESRIRANLRNLEAIAKQTGFAIGTATAFPRSVDVIKQWASEAQKRGILIVPVSNLLTDYSVR